MKDKLRQLSRSVQLAYENAVRTKDPKDMDEYEKLDDEYHIQSRLYIQKKTKERLDSV